MPTIPVTGCAHIVADGGQQALSAVGEFLRLGEQPHLQIHRLCGGFQVPAASVPH